MSFSNLENYYGISIEKIIVNYPCWKRLNLYNEIIRRVNLPPRPPPKFVCYRFPPGGIWKIRNKTTWFVRSYLVVVLFLAFSFLPDESPGLIMQKPTTLNIRFRCSPFFSIHVNFGFFFEIFISQVHLNSFYAPIIIRKWRSTRRMFATHTTKKG